jgi:HEAT repeat protein
MHTLRHWIAATCLSAALLALPGCPPPAPPTAEGSTATAGSLPKDASDLSPAQSKANLERAIAIIQDQFHSAEPVQRANSLEAIQLLPDPRRLSLLEQGLHDPQWVVRFAAALAAGRGQVTTLQPLLVRGFLSETNANVKVGMVYALKRLGDNTHMSLLAATMHNPDASVRANTALVLGLIGEPSAKAVLWPARRDLDVRVRFEITAALARIGDAEAQKAILAMSINRFAEDYYMALATCPDINRPEVDNLLYRGFHLRDYVKDPTPEERRIVDRAAMIAARGMAKRGDTEPGHLTLELSRSTDPEVRALAALALGEMLYPTEERPLMRLMGDPDPHVQIAAAAATVNVAVRDAQAREMP